MLKNKLLKIVTFGKLYLLSNQIPANNKDVYVFSDILKIAKNCIPFTAVLFVEMSFGNGIYR